MPSALASDTVSFPFRAIKNSGLYLPGEHVVGERPEPILEIPYLSPGFVRAALEADLRRASALAR
jgi:hypothetical protein